MESNSNPELTNADITSNEQLFNEEENIEQDKVTLLGNFIRDNSIDGKISNAEDFLDEPLLLEVEEALSLIEELKARDEFSDICVNKGKEKIYLYSKNYITNNYANMVISVEEKDHFKMIADIVRQESKVYPRPTDARLFNKAPFKLTKEEFYEIYKQLKNKDEYKDIKEARASNNALYLYSDKFMKKALADSLTEWIEVEAEQNP